MGPGQHKFRGAGVIAALPRHGGERLCLSAKLHFEAREAAPPIQGAASKQIAISPVRRSLTAMCGGKAAVGESAITLACFDSIQQLT
jgi:hypothetical protein